MASKRNKTRLAIEQLEARDVPAITLGADGVLTLTGIVGPDRARIYLNDGLITARVSYGTTVERQSFAPSSVRSFVYSGLSGDDRFVNDTNLTGLAGGGQGNDYLEAGNVGNVLQGGPGNDTLVGFAGRDTLTGGVGHDYMFGLTNNDLLQGNDGNDFHYGGPGTDTLNDNLGSNVKDGVTDGPLAEKTEGWRGQKVSDYLNSDSDLSAIEQAIFELTNAERARFGLAPFALNSKLVSAAQHHATNMAFFNRMSHSLPEADLPNLVDRINHYQYSWSAAAENIAWNYQSAEHVMSGWMNSSGHRANILGNYTEFGVGVRYNASGEPYYCQVFGRPG